MLGKVEAASPPLGVWVKRRGRRFYFRPPTIGGNVLNFGRIIGVIGAFWCILETDIVAPP